MARQNTDSNLSAYTNDDSRIPFTPLHHNHDRTSTRGYSLPFPSNTPDSTLDSRSALPSLRSHFLHSPAPHQSVPHPSSPEIQDIRQSTFYPPTMNPSRSQSPPITPSPRGFIGTTSSVEIHAPTPASNVPGFNQTVLSAAMVDKAAMQFKLDKTQRQTCHTFVQICSQDPPLTRADTSARLFMLAHSMQMVNEAKARDEERSRGTEDYKGMLDDMKARISTSFALSTEQLSEVRNYLQDLLFEKTRTSFCKVHNEAKINWKKEKISLKLANVVGNPAREKTLNTKAGRMSSSIRNQMQNEIYASIAGPTRKSLKDFTYDTAIKYKRGGPGSKELDSGLLAHKAILRRFAREHPELHGKKEKENASNDPEEDDPDSTGLWNWEDHTHGSEGPPAKKRKAGEGELKAKNFWGAVDEWFALQLKARGSDFGTELWKEYIKETITLDMKYYSPVDENTELDYAEAVSISLNSSSSSTTGIPITSSGFVGASSSSTTAVPTLDMPG
ncbi:hypothetical protein K435DRAFT_806470, partial [Dendrothele bispora CBS 962.96]